ncbi:GNAT family N-acetyltransferase [Caulobacter sp. S45]|uniref:GNAT family N-acetyltransferase n=1 Tax=Caulobacter sp. S45 TaxID=1641861 RepID=UPI001C2DA19F|nr:GNAT family N-acetyltransferase [Caulobacter sp. S45]
MASASDEGAFRIRPYRPEDAALLGPIYFEAVRLGSANDYTVEQREAWSPSVRDGSWYEARAQDGRFILVAVDLQGSAIAYGELEADGHLDHLYCRPEYLGLGVGAALYDALEREARRRGVSKLYVEASEAARRLFLKKDFTDLGRRDFQLRGASIHNYAMVKRLGG